MEINTFHCRIEHAPRYFDEAPWPPSDSLRHSVARLRCDEFIASPVFSSSREIGSRVDRREIRFSGILLEILQVIIICESFCRRGICFQNKFNSNVRLVEFRSSCERLFYGFVEENSHRLRRLGISRLFVLRQSSRSKSVLEWLFQRTNVRMFLISFFISHQSNKKRKINQKPKFSYLLKIDSLTFSVFSLYTPSTIVVITHNNKISPHRSAYFSPNSRSSRFSFSRSNQISVGACWEAKQGASEQNDAMKRSKEWAALR